MERRIIKPRSAKSPDFAFFFKALESKKKCQKSPDFYREYL